MYLKIQIFPKFSKYIFRDTLEKKIFWEIPNFSTIYLCSQILLPKVFPKRNSLSDLTDPSTSDEDSHISKLLEVSSIQ